MVTFSSISLSFLACRPLGALVRGGKGPKLVQSHETGQKVESVYVMCGGSVPHRPWLYEGNHFK